MFLPNQKKNLDFTGLFLSHSQMSLFCYDALVKSDIG